MTMRRKAAACLADCSMSKRLPSRFSLLVGWLLLFLVRSVASAQVIPETKYISTNYGVVEGDFSFSVRLSGQVRNDMGVEVVLGMVPSRGELSDIYSLILFQYHLWPKTKFVPHLVGGAGAVTAVGMGRREVDFVVAVGGGIMAFISENLALRLDVENRSVFLEEDTHNRQSISGGVVLIF